jgi:hypothetical protein
MLSFTKPPYVSQIFLADMTRLIPYPASVKNFDNLQTKQPLAFSSTGSFHPSIFFKN